MEQLTLAPIDHLSITTLVENTIDVFMPDQGPAHRLTEWSIDRTVPAMFLDRPPVEHPRAEHGFSALIAASVGGDRRTLLFDAGRTPGGLAHNLRCIGIDPGVIEAVVLSHGHFDHTTGLDGFARLVGASNLPVVIHPEFWNRRRIVLPGRDPWELPSTSRRGLEGSGFEVIEGVQPSFLLGGSVLVTGEIDRRTDFERGFPIQEAWRDESWVPDPMVLDDQAIIIHVKDRGLVVMTGCGHAGVINTLQYARELTGVEEIHAVIGGFHLNGPIFEPLIPQVCDAMAMLEPDVVVPGHCTGWRATHALARAMPDAFVPNSVGSVFTFGDAPD